MKTILRLAILTGLVLMAAGEPASALDRYQLHVKSASDYVVQGDEYTRMYRFGMAAECYKIALKKDPENQAIWAKHRDAMEKGKAVGDLVRRAQKYLRAGQFEEAARLLQQAVKINPRDDSVWGLYEGALRRNPNVIVILDEREAWEAFKKGKSFLEADRLEEAKLYFSRVSQSTQDSSLQYYAEKYLAKTEELMKRHYPNEQVNLQ